MYPRQVLTKQESIFLILIIICSSLSWAKNLFPTSAKLL